MDEEPGLEPISYLVARQEQEPCEIVVLSLASTGQPAADPFLSYLHGNCLGALALDQDARAAEHRKNLAVRHLRTIGCKASGFISAEDLVRAVRSETGDHNYDQVILAAGRQPGTWLARVLRRDPVHRLRRRWGRRLIAFPLGLDAPRPMPSSWYGSHTVCIRPADGSARSIRTIRSVDQCRASGQCAGIRTRRSRSGRGVRCGRPGPVLS